MKGEIEIRTGLVPFELPGIVNYDEVKERLGMIEVNPICKSGEDKKKWESKLEEYKKIRKPLVSEGAKVQNLGDAAISRIKAEFKEIIGLVDNHKEPIIKAIKDYEEIGRSKRFAKLKEEVTPKLEELNIQIETMNKELNYKLVSTVLFDDEWKGKSSKTVFGIIDTELEDAENKIKQAKNNIEAIKSECELLKLKYDLKSPMSYKLILGNKIYTEQLVDLKKILDDTASDQQEKELEVERLMTEEVERKSEKERLVAEQKQKRLIQEAEDKVREEERSAFEKQQAKLDGEKKRVKKETKSVEATENATPKDHIVEFEKETYSKTIKFPKLTNKDTNLMIRYFEDNNIEWEMV